MATPALKVGQNVKITSNRDKPQQGILRYIGPLHGGVAPGTWCGVELPDATGKNDGTVKGYQYFQCEPDHGLFVKREAVVPVATTKSPAKRLSTVPSSTTNPRLSAAVPASKRASIAPTSRPSNVRQSITTIPPKRAPASRPSSQVISRETAPSRTNRLSVQSTLQEPPLPKQIPEEPTEQDKKDESEEVEEEDDEQVEEDHKHEEQDAPFSAPMHPPPRRESTSQHAPLRAQTKEQTNTNLQISRENDQLKVKLRAIEKRRVEDRDKIKQIDTLQSENERLNNIIRALQTKLKTTTEERRHAQDKVQELEQKVQPEPQGLAQLESELELATLDKEMAEEKAESLQHELEIIKANYEELELETDILRDENKELASTMTEEEKAGAGWIHLERERDRLREALLLLRDNKKEVEQDLQEEIHHLRDNLNETEETAAKYLEAAEQLNRVEDTNAHLKEQLEAAENQEEVISNMMQERDRHLAQIEDLRSSLSEMEELAQTNEDLEKLYLDNEKVLLSRLDGQEAVIHDREREVSEQDQRVEDLEYTLNKFRSVVQGLQSDIDESRRRREISELQAHEMNSRSKAMMDLNLRLQNTAAKTQTKAIDIEMVKAHAALQEWHIQILSLFLPESFDSERTPITALLSFSRLRTKAGLVASMLSERLRDRPHLSSGEEILSAYKIVQSMHWIQHTADRFERFISSCSPAEFAAFSNAGQELEPVERAVTNWLEALKNDELGLDEPEHMQRMQSVLTDMTEKLIPTGAEMQATNLVTETHMSATHAEVAASLLDWLAKSVKIKVGEPKEDDPDSIEFDRKIDHLSTRARTIRYACGKVASELDRRRTKNTCLNETAWPLFSMAEGQALTITEHVQQLCQIAITYFNDIDHNEKPSYTALFDSFNDSDSDNFPTLLNDMKSLQDQVEVLATKAADSSSVLTFEPQSAPWTIRAKDIKTQRLISVEMQEELVQSVRTNQELALRIVEKERAIEEMAIRAELAEKRVKDNKSKEAQDKLLKDEIERVQKEKETIDEQLSALKTDMMDLQQESAKDKEQILSLQKSTPNASLTGINSSSHNHIMDPATNDVISAHVNALLAEIAALESTVRHLTYENRHLSTPLSELTFRAATNSWLDPAILTNAKIKSRATTRVTRAQIEQRDALDALLDVSRSTMSMKPVRLVDTWRRDDKWRSVKESTRWKVLRQKEEVEALNLDALSETGGGVGNGTGVGAGGGGFVVRVR